VNEIDELERRVQQFNELKLPGQPKTLHMGTFYLVNDLWREIERLRGIMKKFEPEEDLQNAN
jgi:hypothetical protein